MPIERAGPFADNDGSYLDEPTVLDGAIAQVNCNNKTKSFWRWGYVFVAVAGTGTSSILDYGSSQSFTLSNAINTQGKIVFYYQAADSWSFPSSSYFFEVVGSTGDFLEVRFEVFVNGASVFDDSEDNTSSGANQVEVSGNINSIVFPASVVPVRVEISAQGSSNAFDNSLNGNIFFGLISA